uniref:Uncharacterized protein n=1 Tax=Ditylenchus dipsaci TaxID=166011 RepID=A0A915EAQ5_9BILA
MSLRILVLSLLLVVLSVCTNAQDPPPPPPTTTPPPTTPTTPPAAPPGTPLINLPIIKQLAPVLALVAPKFGYDADSYHGRCQ